MKTFILKRLKEELLVDESFDKPLSNIEKIDDFEYNVSEDDIKAKILFRLEVNDDNKTIGNPIIDTESIKLYYAIYWGFINDSIKTPFAWKRITATLFKVLTEFIVNIKPKLIYFTDEHETGKIYYHPEFENTLNKQFPSYYIYINTDTEQIIMINKNLIK